jgi:EAL domain-containing protein (putative c-di-GMP-specific phosphodiesterase class I)
MIAINLSAAQLNVSPDFDQEINQQLRKWGIEPEAIEFELTESVLMATTREHGDIIERLCRLGVSIAIDDFGTGYSSLEYLRAYRVTHLKIAQEFIRDLEADSGDAAIVRATISLARELEIKAIAEGVETQSQLDLLVQSGCQYVQGYCFSPPVSAAHAAQILRRERLVPVWQTRSQPLLSAHGNNSLRGMPAQFGGGRS